jgi:hypothetical protein
MSAAVNRWRTIGRVGTWGFWAGSTLVGLAAALIAASGGVPWWVFPVLVSAALGYGLSGIALIAAGAGGVVVGALAPGPRPRRHGRWRVSGLRMAVIGAALLAVGRVALLAVVTSLGVADVTAGLPPAPVRPATQPPGATGAIAVVVALGGLAVALAGLAGTVAARVATRDRDRHEPPRPTPETPPGRQVDHRGFAPSGW